MALILAVGLISLGGFDALFLKFHQISFRNDLWQLNPNTDYLLMMFPQGFWFDSTALVAAITIIGSVVTVAVSGGYLLWRRRRPEAGIRHQPTAI